MEHFAVGVLPKARHRGSHTLTAIRLLHIKTIVAKSVFDSGNLFLRLNFPNI